MVITDTLFNRVENTVVGHRREVTETK